MKEKTEYDNCLDLAGKKKPSLAAFRDKSHEEKMAENDNWETHWVDMPEFDQPTKEDFAKIIVRFRNDEDLQEFAKMVDQKLTTKSKSIWYPKLKKDVKSLRRWVEED
jgi:hypothetical protein